MRGIRLASAAALVFLVAGCAQFGAIAPSFMRGAAAVECQNRLDDPFDVESCQLAAGAVAASAAYLSTAESRANTALCWAAAEAVHASAAHECERIGSANDRATCLYGVAISREVAESRCPAEGE